MSCAPSLLSLAAYFLRIGVLGFGGPPAHIAMMRAELVEQRRWISAQQFNTDLATANLLPGPTSTELAIYIGLRLHGARGAVLSGVCFILPAFLLVLAISVAYVHFGAQTRIEQWLYGVKPVALALIIVGTARIGQPVMQSWREWLLLIVCVLALLVGGVNVLLLMVLSGVALVAFMRAQPSVAGWAALVTLAQASAVLSPLVVLWEFLKIGALIYGGGFALAGILHQELVAARGWITQEQLLYAIAIGQSTPGPVFTTATFIGYLLSGPTGAVLATVGIFAPGFVFVLLEHRALGVLKQGTLAQTFLRGVSVAVTATLILSAVQLAQPALPDLVTMAMGAISVVALARFKLEAHWLIAAGLAVSVIRSLAIGTL